MDKYQDSQGPDPCPLRHVSVEDVENCFSEGEFYPKKFKIFTKMG